MVDTENAVVIHEAEGLNPVTGREAVRQYLSSAFGQLVREEETDAGWKYEVQRHTLIVPHAMAACDGDAVTRILDESAVKDELARAEDLEMVLTREGIRLASSN